MSPAPGQGRSRPTAYDLMTKRRRPATSLATMGELDAWFATWIAEARQPEAVTEWVEETLTTVVAAVPDLGGELEPLVRLAIEQHWLAFLDKVGSDRDYALAPAARTLALEVAQRHLGLPVLVKAYRAAQRSSWSYVTGVIRDSAAELDHVELLVRLWGEAAAWFDASVEESILIHQQEARRIEQRGDAQRYATVAALLADGESGDIRSRPESLDGYPLTGSHIALIARALSLDAVDALEQAVVRMMSATGLRWPLVVRPGGREVWCWVAADALPERWQHTPDPALVRVTVGGPAEGAEGFALAHREARATQAVALEQVRPRPVTAYADVTALIMMARDHEAAWRFVVRTLGGLAKPGAGRLRETVRHVLTEGGTESVASALRVHKNTVRYRVAQAERLLGRPIRERAGDLLLALDYFDAFLAQPE